MNRPPIILAAALIGLAALSLAPDAGALPPPPPPDSTMLNMRWDGQTKELWVTRYGACDAGRCTLMTGMCPNGTVVATGNCMA
jgi:hypothetical protein